MAARDVAEVLISHGSLNGPDTITEILKLGGEG